MGCWRSLCSIAWFAAMSAGQETLSDSPQDSTPLLATTVSTMKVISFRPRYPYIVSIGENLKGYYKHLCVGVILSNEFVLSAAHCLQTNPTKELYVAGGADSLNSRKQTRFFVVERRWHPQFRMLGGNDIAVLRIYPKFPLDDVRFRSINFAGKPQRDSGIQASLVGWGRVGVGKIRKLQEMPFLTMENDECLRSHRFVFLKPLDICAMHLKGPRGPCDGDSGAPLMNVAKEKLYGLLSYGRKACTPLKPYAFTRINAYSSWIQESMDYMAASLKVIRMNRTVWKDGL
ncbi:granzyme M [Drosophila mauritiana]|uniref:Granzyme M n=1 Tax=Drosophila mauritiana TaxID=7226 RepID=A0A6P8KIX4_DROMA|nr:granzyme M [Drosophila mauritiana]